MLKVLAVGFGLLAASLSSAFALDEGQAVGRWHEAQYVCKIGEEPNGNAVPEKVRDAVCQERERLTRTLEKDDFCWSESEQEWYPAGQDNGFCARLN